MKQPERYVEPRLTQYLFDRASRTLTPLSGTFELSPVCNLACKMCYVRKTPAEVAASPRPPVGLIQWLSIAEQARDAGMLYLLLTGGEPFLWQDFWPLYERLSTMGFLISINSNATLLDEARVARLAEHPPTRINITLYGAGNETYEALCGRSGMFDRVDRAITLLRQAGILFDGRDAAGLSKHTLRRGISSVLQGAAIYSGTIGENIRMGDPDADDAAVTEAARIAQLSDFIASCEGGLSYEIRQAGKNLSGGQKQRLAIARAIIKDAPIYIFDDSFSALDFLTEKNLRTALNRRIAGRTQIVVTQRITSAMSADCIFVMDGGCLVDSGTHNELLARCRIYREIYASQTGGDLQ